MQAIIEREYSKSEFLELMNSIDLNDIVFESTGDGTHIADFWNSLIPGIAPGKNLYVPKEFPEKFEQEFFEKILPYLSVDQVSGLVLRKYIGRDDISDERLAEMTHTAHDFDIPLQEIDANTMIAWLDQGKTASFKDIAARAIAQLMTEWCEAHQTPKNIVVATSGDTGVAICNAFADSKWITVTVLYPKDGVSEMQEKQMLDTAEKYDNIQVMPIDGDFDYCQNTAKLTLEAAEIVPENLERVGKLRAEISKLLNQDLSEDEIVEFITTANESGLTSANSINLWRLVPQITQYFYSYGQAVRQGRIKPGQEIVFAIPTGNVGHLMAGIYAKELGLPIKKFVVGTNQNNTLANLIAYGVVDHNGSEKTLAPSMDILEPSNLVRLLHFVAKKVDPTAEIDFNGMKMEIIGINDEIEKHLKANPDEPMPFKAPLNVRDFGVTDAMMEYLQENFWVDDINNNIEITDIIKDTYKKTDERVVMESHGSAAKKATDSARAEGFIDEDDFVIILETAHPDKFPDAMKGAEIKDSGRPHPELEKLKKISLDSFEKPESPYNVLDIIKGTRSLMNILTAKREN